MKTIGKALSHLFLVGLLFALACLAATAAPLILAPGDKVPDMQGNRADKSHVVVDFGANTLTETAGQAGNTDDGRHPDRQTEDEECEPAAGATGLAQQIARKESRRHESEAESASTPAVWFPATSLPSSSERRRSASRATAES